jgi:uncharacterized protein YbjT (DUF2867 family)
MKACAMPQYNVNEHNYKVATVFGGTGFLGRHVVRELARLGYTVKVATRYPSNIRSLRVNGAVGQIVPVPFTIRDQNAIDQAVRGSQVVVNCVGILKERKKGDFKEAHIDLPEEIALSCERHRVKRLVHISSLTDVPIDGQGISQYAKSKMAGEAILHAIFPEATVLRPSVMFGPGDHILGRFAEMARYLPFIPLFGKGVTLFDPVYVGDVSDAVMASVALPVVGPMSPLGKTYELGGPDRMALGEIVERVFFYTKRSRKVIPLSWRVSKILATILGALPFKIITRDEIKTLRKDSIVDGQEKGFVDLGITPTSMDLIAPQYLSYYVDGGEIALRKAA